MFKRNDGMSTMFDDRPYQREAIEAVHKAHAMGLQRTLVALPTGTGKTIIFAGSVAILI
jgi:superfamily II DNA or RNA helicase